MWKHQAAFAAALSALLLASCGSREGVSAEANTLAPGGNAQENSTLAEPAPPGNSAGPAAEPVPPPDAVSHPDGYLPPAPDGAEPSGANSAGADESPPSTEDEYIRNGQGGR